MHLDIFRDDAFSLVEMTEGLDRYEFQPSYLGSLGIFTPEPIRTTSFTMEERDGELALVPTTERGTPIIEGDRRRRKLRTFETVRIAKGTTIHAAEIQGVRPFGAQSELMAAQELIADRLTGPVGILNDVEMTFEHMRLGALKGEVLDADGSTIIDWYDAFDLAKPDDINFALNDPQADIRKTCADLVRRMARKSKGAFTPGTQIHALCGDEFYDALVQHPTVRETYLNYAAAADLRTSLVTSGANGTFGMFPFAGITFHNYRGTDDGTRVSIGANDAHFFPVGARNVFSHVQAPGEFFDFVNTPGRRVYSMILTDRDRNAWVRPEVYAYPLFVCKRPDLLETGKLSAGGT
jgi:hypothetical protein